MSDLIPPSVVYSETHSSKMSEKYVHIRTADVLSRFQDMGWAVASVNSAKHSKTPQFARHALRLRHKDFLDINQDGVIPELIVLNSHNGSWALRMALGMFRMVCSNGMVAGSVWEGVSLRHYNIKNLEDQITSVTERMDDLTKKLSGTVKQWMEVEVPFREQVDFANKAMGIRWGDKTTVTAEQLLLTRRDADKGSDLWHVFNRVQENLTQGGFTGVTSNNRTLSIKPVKNVKRDFKFNSELFDLASTYAVQGA